MNFELKKLSLNDNEEVYNFLQKIPKSENGFSNKYNGLTYDKYRDKLKKDDDMSMGFGLENWMVSATEYWFYFGEKPIGIGRIRHRLTEKLLENGGHIGYAIIPSERNKGYGKILVKLLIEKAREMGIDKVLITVNNENHASIKVALNGGGRIEKVTDKMHYIWVDCVGEK
ncbi:MAG: GNAT family N-acetyltransferase [Oscillospiraceae bacterium]|nr:GNAT family N-acetyltransferase [Oscillospiraceae bacterium]